MAVARRAGGVAVAGPRVAQQNRVGTVGVEPSPRLVGDVDVVQHRADVEREPATRCDPAELPYEAGFDQRLRFAQPVLGS